LSDATPVQSQRLIGELQRNNRILPLILEMEKYGYAISVQDAILDIKGLNYAEAIPRLPEIERDFSAFYQSRRSAVPEAELWKRFEEWQKAMYPSDPGSMGNLMRVAKRMGVPDLFTGAFDLRRASIDLKARVRSSLELSRYYYDLFLVREFLISEGYHQVGKEQNGRRLAELLLNKEGNCVTLSLLFTHLAGTLEREVSFGLLPDHMYLITKGGGAIESTMSFGMTNAMAYQRRSRPVEAGPQDARHMMGFHLLNLGKIFFREQNHESAGESFELSQRLLPKNPRPALELGRLSVFLENYRGAADHFRTVHELYPDENGYGLLRYQAWDGLAMGDLGRAERAFSKMNSANPNDIDVYRGLRVIYERQRRRQEAGWVRDMIELLEGS